MSSQNKAQKKAINPTNEEATLIKLEALQADPQVQSVSTETETETETAEVSMEIEGEYNDGSYEHLRVTTSASLACLVHDLKQQQLALMFLQYSVPAASLVHTYGSTQTDDEVEAYELELEVVPLVVPLTAVLFDELLVVVLAELDEDVVF